MLDEREREEERILEREELVVYMLQLYEVPVFPQREVPSNQAARGPELGLCV